MPSLLVAVSLLLSHTMAVHSGVTEISDLFHWVPTLLPHTPYTVQLPSQSLHACAGQCAGSSDCSSLCYSASTSTCYMIGDSLATQTAPGDITDLTCFKKECPSVRGYRMHGGLCLKLSRATQSYTDATLTCQADGAHLAHFKSPAHLTAFQSLYLSEGVTVDLWVGADDLDTEGSFVWRSDGTPLLTTDPLWHNGQPDVLQNDEDCVNLYPHSWRLNDNDCNTLYAFVCQMEV